LNLPMCLVDDAGLLERVENLSCSQLRRETSGIQCDFGVLG